MFAARLHSLQILFAMRGLSLLKVGGGMVYSTCSMNPIENEAVVAEVLQRCGESVKLLDVSSELPQLIRRLGLKRGQVCLQKSGESFRNNFKYFMASTSDLHPATATQRVQNDMVEMLHIRRCINFVSGQLNNLELAVSLAKRGNLPGAEKLVVERFHELFSQTKYKEAAEVAAESPQGILRTPDTVAKFHSVPVQAGQTPPLLQYFGTLFTRILLNA